MIPQLSALIGCECSGTVRDAFRRESIPTWSCDIKPCEKGSKYHLQGDIISAVLSAPQWDFIGLHPDCTALTVAGNHVYAEGKPKWGVRLQAVEWTVELFNLAKSKAKCGYLENPMGVLSTLGGMPKPQIIQPYNFGENASKKTCLWIWGLPQLKNTIYYPGQHACSCGHRSEELEGITTCPDCGKKKKLIWGNQTPSGQNKLSPSPNRKADRSRTYPGIADAMAQQWGEILKL